MKYFNQILIVVIMILSCIDVFAQGRNVIGKVVDSETMEPLIGVHVRCSNNTTTTNVNGEFTISVIENDKYIRFNQQKIKELRLENGVLQRQLASLLEINTPMFSKIERGDRRAKCTQVIKMANFFNIDEKELLTLWVADKVLDAVEDEEELKSDAIKVVLSSIE